MKIINSIINFFKFFADWWIVRAAKKKQKERFEEKKKAEKFEKEVEKEVKDGDIDDINEKLKF